MITDIEIVTKYDSLTPFIWKDVPQLAVIIGPNGVGKTHLLEAIYKQLTNYPNFENGALPLRFTCHDHQQPPLNRIAFIESNWHGPISSSANRYEIDTLKDKIVNLLKSMPHGPNAPSNLPRVKAFIEQESGRSLNELSDDEIRSYIKPEHLAENQTISFNSHLSALFMAYHSKKSDIMHQIINIKKQVSDDDVVKKIGVAPWDMINKTLKEYDFEYKVTHPTSDSVDFQCQFKHTATGKQIAFTRLSSGEKMIVTLIFWVYNEELGKINDLILMDEPDAHLHPSMTKLFYQIVSEVLVGRYNIQVIFTTHNPSTVALLPDNNIFIMQKDKEQRIKKASSKQEALALLTDNLLLVTNSFKIVFVEGKDDPNFYNAVYEICTVHEHIDTTTSLIFKPISPNHKNSGKHQVAQWAETLNHLCNDDSIPLQGLFTGLIDQDFSNKPSPNLHVLGRYSIENYLIDPIVVFATLLTKNDPEAVKIGKQHNIHSGTLFNIHKMPATTLQKIADDTLSLFKTKFDALNPSKDTTSVLFASGQALSYPKYILDTPGKDLIGIILEKFNKSSIRRKDLENMIRSLPLIPAELVETMRKLSSISGKEAATTKALESA